MDEDLKNEMPSNEKRPESESPADSSTNTAESSDINNFSMDVNGNIKRDNGAAAVSYTNTKTYVVLGWICAALAAFVQPLFAVAGIVLGVLAGRRVKGSGTVVIITNVVVAAAYYILRFIFYALVGGMAPG